MKKLRTFLKEETIELENKDGSNKVFLMRELNGYQREEYMDKLAKRMKFDAAGKPSGFATYKGTMTDLVSDVLFEQDGQTKVNPEFVKSLPQETVSALFEMAQEMNGLGEDAEVKAKNV